MSQGNTAPVDFLHRLQFEQLPPGVQHQAWRCLLDLAGVAAAGSATAMAQRARGYAAVEHAVPQSSGAARLWFDGRPVTAGAAAFAGAATLDSFDGHDGHVLTKGHAGAAVLPALLALAGRAAGAAGEPPGGWELLTALVVGYEIATRAGIALHASAGDYHSSGSWNALGCAAVGARLLGLGPQHTAHALGIAEYHGPRGPMMHCIETPSMVKDGTAWGAHTGVSAALLAGYGYTGAPARLLDVPGSAAGLPDLWGDLGERWRILEQYVKPYPVCRWAHPAVHAVLEVTGHGTVPAGDIERITVRTFTAAASLGVRRPENTEQAQYSLPFPTAAAAVHGGLPVSELTGPPHAHPETLRLSAGMQVTADARFDAEFPARRFARVTVQLRDGRTLRSGPVEAPGGPEEPLTDAELTAKYRALSQPVLGEGRAARLERAVAAVADGGPVGELLQALGEPVPEVAAQGPEIGSAGRE